MACFVNSAIYWIISIFLNVTLYQASNGENTGRTSLCVEESEDRSIGGRSKAKGQQDVSRADAIRSHGLEKV